MKPRTLVVLAIFSVVFVTLQVSSYRQKSATWDEPIHVTMGDAALARSDYRVDPEHPPFLPGGPAAPGDQPDEPVLPGYVALSATNLVGVDKPGTAEPLPATARTRPIARVGGSIYVYWMNEPWW